MTIQKIEATTSDDNDLKASHEVEYDFGDSLDEAVKLFGGDVVFARFKAATIVDLQGVMRRLATGKEPKVGKSLQEAVNEWKPGVSKVRKSKSEKAMDLLSGMDVDEVKALLEEMKKNQAKK